MNDRMSKPTFIQTLLNRPSQSYLKLQQQQQEAQKKDSYYSAKGDLLRRYSIAVEGASLDSPGTGTHQAQNTRPGVYIVIIISVTLVKHEAEPSFQ
jgi:hypothetical protein